MANGARARGAERRGVRGTWGTWEARVPLKGAANIQSPSAVMREYCQTLVFLMGS